MLLFAVKLPELLAYVKIEEETQIQLQQKLLDFLKYVLHNLLFAASYPCGRLDYEFVKMMRTIMLRIYFQFITFNTYHAFAFLSIFSCT